MPTEEVFTITNRNIVNRTVSSSNILIYGCNLINNFTLTFKNCKVVDFTTKEGYDILKELLSSDESARHLGEFALVPYDSPISNSNIIFYNALFEKGANSSIVYVDFMIGNKDLNIVVINKENQEIQI